MTIGNVLCNCENTPTECSTSVMEEKEPTLLSVHHVPICILFILLYIISFHLYNFMIKTGHRCVHLNCMYKKTEVWGNLTNCLSSHNR